MASVFTLKDAALHYADMGLKVFPLKVCGKTPATAHGFHDATRDTVQIQDWWSREDYNIGICTGSDNGILVIDIDQKPSQEKHGEDSLKVLESKLGSLPNTWEVRTGTGGRHLYFRYPEGHEIRNSASALADNIDVRGQGGYIVAPPSIHPETHKRYQWTRYEKLSELPDAWITATEERRQQVYRKAPKNRKKIVKAKGFVMPDVIPQGARNDTLFRYGCSLRSISIDQGEILECMSYFNFRSCTPPLTDRELQRIYKSVLKYNPGQ